MGAEFIGFTTNPYALILWTKPGDTEPSNKTVCYDAGEVQDNLDTLNTWRTGYTANVTYAV